jgi:UDP-MurNAc hydroxylase
MFSIQSAKLFKQKYGPLSLAMLNYNAAGPYPSCFDNLTESEKTLESKRIILRNLRHMLGVIHELQPSFVMPFAGAYVIGGKFAYRNKYLGTSTWDECGDFLKSNGIKPEHIVLLRESDTFDIENGRSDKPYQIVNTSEIEEYVERTLSKIAYPYESDAFPNEEQLYLDVESSSLELIRRMRKLELASTFAVIVKVFNRRLQIYPEFKVFENEERPKRVLECSLDERLLRRILDKNSHWNNAEIGTHISFYRSPNEYEYDLHTALQFFHLP